MPKKIRTQPVTIADVVVEFPIIKDVPIVVGKCPIPACQHPMGNRGTGITPGGLSMHMTKLHTRQELLLLEISPARLEELHENANAALEERAAEVRNTKEYEQIMAEGEAIAAEQRLMEERNPHAASVLKARQAGQRHIQAYKEAKALLKASSDQPIEPVAPKLPVDVFSDEVPADLHGVLIRARHGKAYVWQGYWKEWELESLISTIRMSVELTKGY